MKKHENLELPEIVLQRTHRLLSGKGISMKELLNQLTEAKIGKVWENEPLKYHTTLKVGGPADVLVQPEDKEKLITCLRIIHSLQLPYRVIGRGSNLLVKDGGIRGVVIKLGNGLDYLKIDNCLITAGAGLSFVKLATIIAKKGLSGLEFAGGIPGTVGGAVYMNAGAHGSDVSKVLASAEIFFDDGELAILTNEELEFNYRSSLIQVKRPGTCLEATFKLNKGNRHEIAAEMAKHKDYRRLTQPLKQPCCGSVFRNPKPHSAGQLIEKAGLKGYRIGEAQISPLHANFIVNLGNASAQDVLELINHIQATVYTKFGIEMKPEVQVMGEE